MFLVLSVSLALLVSLGTLVFLVLCGLLVSLPLLELLWHCYLLCCSLFWLCAWYFSWFCIVADIVGVGVCVVC